MKTKMMLMLLAMAAAAATLAFSGNEKGDKIEWLSFSEALEKAKAEKKIVVVDFYTDWCSWCKVMDKKTYGNKDVIKFASEKIVMVKVNAESNEKTSYRGKEYTYRQLSQGFRVNSFPATVFLNEEGEFITNVPGYISPEKFIPMLEYMEGEHYKTTPFDEFLKKREKKQTAPSGE